MSVEKDWIQDIQKGLGMDKLDPAWVPILGTWVVAFYLSQINKNLEKLRQEIQS